MYYIKYNFVKIVQALAFLGQLLHRHVQITAWGFYNINKEFMFLVNAYKIIT